jgi:hypothetical protein
MSRNFSEKKLTGAVFLDVAKAFSTQLVDGLLYKLTAYNFPWFLVKTIFIPAWSVDRSALPNSHNHAFLCRLAWLRVK